MIDLSSFPSRTPRSFSLFAFSINVFEIPANISCISINNDILGVGTCKRMGNASVRRAILTLILERLEDDAKVSNTFVTEAGLPSREPKSWEKPASPMESSLQDNRQSEVLNWKRAHDIWFILDKKCLSWLWNYANARTTVGLRWSHCYQRADRSGIPRRPLSAKWYRWSLKTLKIGCVANHLVGRIVENGH